MRNDLSLKDSLWSITKKLQNGLKENGFNLGDTEDCVTPVFLSGGLGGCKSYCRPKRKLWYILF